MISIKKLKIYLDTSVISYLDQKDSRERMEDTLKLWDRIVAGDFEVYISETTIKEVDNCYEPKRSFMLEKLQVINKNLIELNDFEMETAREIVEQGILSNKSMDDATHIAAALSCGCDIIVSWNFKHMVNIKTLNGIKKLAFENHLKPIDIYSPTVLIGDDKYGEI